jgi:hypothetical protein
METETTVNASSNARTRTSLSRVSPSIHIFLFYLFLHIPSFESTLCRSVLSLFMPYSSDSRNTATNEYHANRNHSSNSPVRAGIHCHASPPIHQSVPRIHPRLRSRMPLPTNHADTPANRDTPEPASRQALIPRSVPVPAPVSLPAPIVPYHPYTVSPSSRAAELARTWLPQARRITVPPPLRSLSKLQTRPCISATSVTNAHATNVISAGATDTTPISAIGTTYGKLKAPTQERLASNLPTASSLMAASPVVGEAPADSTDVEGGEIP